MSVRFQLRDCFRPLDYGLLATIVMVFPVAFELGIEVPWVVGFGGSLYCVAALLVVAFRSGREAERLAYGAPDQSLPPLDRRYWLHILASVWLVIFIKGPVVEAIALGGVMRLVKFIALMGRRVHYCRAEPPGKSPPASPGIGSEAPRRGVARSSGG